MRRGDFRAQIAANELAGARLPELIERRGRELVLDAFGEVVAYTERRTREAIAALPDGEYRAESEIEGDGVTGDDIPIRVLVTVDGDRMIDFEGTAPAVAGNVNCPMAVTRSACFFALRLLLPDDVPPTPAPTRRWSCASRGQPARRHAPVRGGRRQRRDEPACRRHRHRRPRPGHGGRHRPHRGPARPGHRAR